MPTTQPSERRAWLLAGVLVVLGAGVLVAVLTGIVGRTGAPGGGGGASADSPPVITLMAATPTAGSASAEQAKGAVAGAQIVAAAPASPQQKRALASFVRAGGRSGAAGATQVHIPAAWMSGFYPIYEQAQSAFGVNWLLLASIHRQESAFSTAPGTYHGLNFARCCGGPMQFNVTNGGAGALSTWALVSDSYLYGRRPGSYDHQTARHPSIYDDFDSIMAAARLLSSDGAGLALDGAAWGAAYDYYGHDEAGIAYADQVLARAIGWSQHGFCVNCGVDPGLLEAVHAAYGAPVEEADAVAAAARIKPGRFAVVGRRPGRRRPGSLRRGGHARARAGSPRAR